MPHIDLHSKAFRKGLLDGFTAYYTYFRPQMYTRARSIDPSIEAAWAKVGEALKGAQNSEWGKSGKKSRETASEDVAA